ncbi:hypothetical protein [Nocardia carnea]|uniref:hypothetical protein n=1 Tax=Nocardia carnea TaxID=37328 RepID=UPI002456F98C|nr:hypothetical protein [Nocardia carnea]
MPTYDDKTSEPGVSARRIRAFTPADVRTWEHIEGGIRLGSVVGEGYGRMSVGFTQLDAGTRAPLLAPYEEVWIVTAGTMIVDSDDGSVSARPGDLIALRAASRGELRVEADVEMIALAYPPAWEIDSAAWESARARSAAGPSAVVLSPGGSPSPWTRGERQELFAAHGKADSAQNHFGVGFWRADTQADVEFFTRHDNLVAATAGQFEIHVGEDPNCDGSPAPAGRGLVMIRQGEFAYLPAGAAGTLSAAPGAELAWAQQTFPPLS